jgi:hypothetical protein
MLNRNTKALVSYGLPALILLTIGSLIGRISAPVAQTITVEKVVEKPVEFIKYVPSPTPVQSQPARIPFGMSEDTAYKYRQCQDTVVTYAIVGANNTVHSGHYFLEDRWPNFGVLISEEDIGVALNENSRIIKLTIKKNACWR